MLYTRKLSFMELNWSKAIQHVFIICFNCLKFLFLCCISLIFSVCVHYCPFDKLKQKTHHFNYDILSCSQLDTLFAKVQIGDYVIFKIFNWKIFDCRYLNAQNNFTSNQMILFECKARTSKRTAPHCCRTIYWAKDITKYVNRLLKTWFYFHIFEYKLKMFQYNCF